MIKAMMACDEQGGIGFEGEIPWPHNEKDMAWFEHHTMGSVLVMGRATWDDSQLSHPMPGRISYVVTSRPESCPEAHGHLSENICEKIIELQHKHPDQQVWIIGGLGLLEQTLGIIEQFYLSKIPGNYRCDRALPLEQLGRWRVHFEEQHPEVTFQILTPPH